MKSKGLHFLHCHAPEYVQTISLLLNVLEQIRLEFGTLIEIHMFLVTQQPQNFNQVNNCQMTVIRVCRHCYLFSRCHTF